MISQLVILLCQPFFILRPVQVRKRGGEKQARLHGFFQGAKVKRGKDWEWGNQDGK